LDVNTERSLNRVSNRSDANKTKVDRIESRGLSFQEKVRQGYLELAKANRRFVVISASQKSIKDIHTELINNLKTLLLNKI
jgi:thymidylate kinase